MDSEKRKRLNFTQIANWNLFKCSYLTPLSRFTGAGVSNLVSLVFVLAKGQIVRLNLFGVMLYNIIDIQFQVVLVRGINVTTRDLTRSVTVF